MAQGQLFAAEENWKYPVPCSSLVTLVLPVLTALLGDQLFPNGICVWSAVVQDQLWAQAETGRFWFF